MRIFRVLLVFFFFVEIGSGVALSDALDQGGQVWVTSPEFPWRGTDLNHHDGSDSAYSSLPDPGESSILKTMVQGPVEIDFWWVVKAPAAFEVSFLIDGRPLMMNLKPLTIWNQVTTLVGPGSHELEWIVTRKDDELTLGEFDGLGLDEFRLRQASQGVSEALGFFPPGSFFEGPVEIGSSGFSDERSVEALSFSRLVLALPEDSENRLRRLSFKMKGLGGGGQVFSSEEGAEWQTTSEWQVLDDGWHGFGLSYGPVQRFVEISINSLFWQQRLSHFIDEVEVETIETLAVESVLGNLLEQLSPRGWYGRALDEVGGEVALASYSKGSALSGQVTGPGWLDFEATLESGNFVAVKIDGRVRSFVTCESSRNQRILIPPGNHEVRLIHDGVNFEEPFALMNHFHFEAIETIPLADALGQAGREFDTSQSQFRDDPGAEESFSVPPFFGMTENGVVGSLGVGQDLSLRTVVEGPALISFRWKASDQITSPPERDHDGGGLVVDWPTGGFSDPGVGVWVNDFLLLQERDGRAGSASSGRPEEPFDPEFPNEMVRQWVGPNGQVWFQRRYVELASVIDVSESDWTEVSFYLGEGVHDLEWLAEIPALPGYSREFGLSDLKIEKVSRPFQVWASNHWATEAIEARKVRSLNSWQNPHADPDGDGFSNALEFAFVTDPRSKSSAPGPAQISFDSVFWPRPFGAVDGVSLIFEGSTDLVNWREYGPLVESIDGIRGDVGLPLGGAQFYRLKSEVTVEGP